MSDVASLGVSFDTSQVRQGRSDLRDLSASARDAAAGTREIASASAQLSSQMAQMLRAQQDTNRTLQEGRIHTTSYVDTLAKIATVGGVVVAAHHAMSQAVGMLTTAMDRQVQSVQSLSDKLQNLGRYGTNAFQLMSDQALAVHRVMTQVAETVASTSSQFAIFTQRFANFGLTPDQNAGAFSTITQNLNGTQLQNILAREQVQRLGVSPNGPSDQVLGNIISALRQIQAGPDRNNIALQIGGDQLVKMVNDTTTAVQQLNEAEKKLQQLKAVNAEADARAASARQKADEEAVAWYSAHPLTSVLAALTGSPTAQRANETARGTIWQNYVASLNQILGGLQEIFQGRNDRIPGGLREGLANFGRTFVGGLGFGNYLAGEPVFPSSTALDYSKPAPAAFREGFAALAGAGDPRMQQLQALTDQATYLTTNWKRLGLTSDQLAESLRFLTSVSSDIVDPIRRQTGVLTAQTTLAGTRPGDRAFVGALQEAVKSLPGMDSTTVNNMSAAQLQEKLGPERVQQISGAIDTLQTTTKQWEVKAAEANKAAAEAAASVGNPVEQLRARIEAELKYRQSLEDSKLGAQDAAIAHAQLAAALAQYQQRRTAAADYLGPLAARRITGAVVPRGGTTGAEGILESGRLTAVETSPDLYGPNSQVPLSDPILQLNTLQRAGNVVESASSMMARMQNMMELQRSAIEAASHGDMGVHGLQSIRQQTGLTTFEREIDSTIAALQREGGAHDDVIAKLIQFKTGLEETAKALAELQKERATAQLRQEMNRQLAIPQAELAAYQSGANPQQVEAVKLAEQYMQQAKATGATISPQEAMATASAIVQANEALTEWKDNIGLWTDSVKNSINAVVDGLDAIIYNDKSQRVSDILKGVALSISKQGLNYFFNQPLKELMGNMLGIGSTPGSHFDLGAQGAGFSNWLGQMFGGGSGGGNQLQNGNQGGGGLFGGLFGGGGGGGTNGGSLLSKIPLIGGLFGGGSSSGGTTLGPQGSSPGNPVFVSVVNGSGDGTAIGGIAQAAGVNSGGVLNSAISSVTGGGVSSSSGGSRGGSIPGVSGVPGSSALNLGSASAAAASSPTVDTSGYATDSGNGIYNTDQFSGLGPSGISENLPQPTADQLAADNASLFGPTEATRYSYSDLLGFAQNAGFTGDAANKAAAIAMAESGGNPNAIGDLTKGGSYGLMQINANAWGSDYAQKATDAQTAFNDAYAISKGGTNFSPWSTYKNGAYQKFMSSGASAASSGGGMQDTSGYATDSGDGTYSMPSPVAGSIAAAAAAASQNPGAGYFNITDNTGTAIWQNGQITSYGTYGGPLYDYGSGQPIDPSLLSGNSAMTSSIVNPGVPMSQGGLGVLTQNPDGSFSMSPNGKSLNSATSATSSFSSINGSSGSSSGGGLFNSIGKFLGGLPIIGSLFKGIGSLFGGGGGGEDDATKAAFKKMGMDSLMQSYKQGLAGVISTHDNDPKWTALNNPGRFKTLANLGAFGPEYTNNPQAQADLIKSVGDNYSVYGAASGLPVAPGVTVFNADHIGNDASQPNIQPSVDSWITPGGIYNNLLQGFSNLTQGKGFHTYPFPAPDVPMPENSFPNLLGSALDSGSKPGWGAENFIARSNWGRNPFNGMGGSTFDIPGTQTTDFTGSAFDLGPMAGNDLTGSVDLGMPTVMDTGGMLGGAGGGFAASDFGAGFSGGLGATDMAGFAGAFSGGGRVGATSNFVRVSPAMFRGAPSMATGGMVTAGARPIIAHEGEVILNAAQQKSVARRMSGGDTHVTMHVTAGNLDGFRSSARQIAGQYARAMNRASLSYQS